MSSPKVKVGSLRIFFLGALSLLFWSLVGGQRDSNARHSRWQRDALPLSYARTLIFHPHRFMLPHSVKSRIDAGQYSTLLASCRARRRYAFFNTPIPCFGSFRSQDRPVRLESRLGTPIRIVCIPRNLRYAVPKRFDLLCIRPTGPSPTRRLGRPVHIVYTQCRCHKFLRHET